MGSQKSIGSSSKQLDFGENVSSNKSVVHISAPIGNRSRNYELFNSDKK